MAPPAETIDASNRTFSTRKLSMRRSVSGFQKATKPCNRGIYAPKAREDNIRAAAKADYDQTRDRLKSGISVNPENLWHRISSAEATPYPAGLVERSRSLHIARQ